MDPKDLRTAIEAGNFAQLRRELLALPEDVRMERLQGLTTEERSQALYLLGPAGAAVLVRPFAPDVVAGFLQSLPDDQLVDVLGELQEEFRESVVAALPRTQRERTLRLLKYGRDTAGGRMSEEFLAFRVDATLGDAIEGLKRERHRRDRPLYLYAVDEQGRLAGVLSIRDLLLEPASTLVGHVMRPDPVMVEHSADQEKVARLFLRHRLMALPVVGPDQKPLGVITPDDVAAIIEEETAEDLLKLSGVSEEEQTRSVRRIIAGRLPWLTINLFLNVVAVSVVAYFEGVIQAVVAVSVLLPIISDMGGNTGIQALSVMIRRLATGRADLSLAWPVFRREALAALFHGVVLGILLGAVAWWWKGIPALGLVAGLALWINTMVAGVTGALIPLVLHRFRFDPASSSGPILTTVTDMTGFFATLKLASLLMPYLIPST